MAWDRFVLKIKMGDDAMQTRDDVATALLEVIRKLRFNAAIAGVVLDNNGNTVGDFTFKTEHEDNDE